MPAHAHRENALGLDELVPHGIAHKFSGRSNIELAHRRRSVSLDCLDADIEQSCDFLVAISFSDKLHDFALARREYG